MLLNYIVSYCDNEYKSYNGKCGRGECNHPSGDCSGNCYNCLYQIHYPPKNTPNHIKTVYDCPKMLDHYVCQYSYLYATEILCALREKTAYLADYPYFHIMSLGCGGCADLMAFEQFYDENDLNVPVSYMGIDVNKLWRPITAQVKVYCENRRFDYQPLYEDVFDSFHQRAIDDKNVIIISYLISYLYNTNQISTIDSLFKDIAQNVVARKEHGQKLLLIINDVNSYKRGRNYFYWLKSKVEEYNFESIVCTEKYFDTGNLYDGQKIGSRYATKSSLFEIPYAIQRDYH